MLEDLSDIIADVLDDEYNDGFIRLPIRSSGPSGEPVYDFRPATPIKYQYSPRKFEDLESGRTVLQPRVLILVPPLLRELSKSGIPLIVEELDDLGGIVIDRVGEEYEVLNANSDPLFSYLSADIRKIGRTTPQNAPLLRTVSGKVLRTFSGKRLTVHGTYI